MLMQAASMVHDVCRTSAMLDLLTPVDTDRPFPHSRDRDIRFQSKALLAPH